MTEVFISFLNKQGYKDNETKTKNMLSDLDNFNTQYMTNSTLACPVKIEYVTKNYIFGLKMMMKSGLEKIILKFLHAQAIFY